MSILTASMLTPWVIPLKLNIWCAVRDLRELIVIGNASISIPHPPTMWRSPITALLFNHYIAFFGATLI